jgi:hypothetical protein
VRGGAAREEDRSGLMAKTRAAGNSIADTPQERIKRYLVQRFYTRFHMSLILMSAGFAAMVTNWALLHLGVGRMWVRYPVAVTASYLTFLAGVWLWIQYVEYRRRGDATGNEDDGAAPAANVSASASAGRRTKARRNGSPLDYLPNSGGGSGGGGGSAVEIPNVLRGGGGAFDGGGAAGSWDDVVPGQAFASNPAPNVPTSSGGIGDMFKGISGDFFDLDGDGVVVIVLALLLICSVLLVSGYIVWFAPDILSEAIFGATLAGGLARAAKREDDGGWVLGVVKKTWWPFAIVFAIAMAFAIYASIHYPAAKTFGEVLSMAVAS